MPINSERVIPVPSSHIKICRFGDDPSSKLFVDYIRDIRSITWNLGAHVRLDHDRVEDRVFVDLHAFYSADPEAGTLPIRIISDRASLGYLIKEGPDACLEEQVHIHMGEVKEDEQKNVSRARTVPVLVFTSPDGEETVMQPDGRSESRESLTSDPLFDSRSVFQGENCVFHQIKLY